MVEKTKTITYIYWALAVIALTFVVIMIVQAVDAGSSKAQSPEPRKVGAALAAGSELERDGAAIQNQMNDIVTRRQRRAGNHKKAVPSVNMLLAPEKHVRTRGNNKSFGVTEIIELANCAQGKKQSLQNGKMGTTHIDLEEAERANVQTKAFQI